MRNTLSLYTGEKPRLGYYYYCFDKGVPVVIITPHTDEHGNYIPVPATPPNAPQLLILYAQFFSLNNFISFSMIMTLFYIWP